MNRLTEIGAVALAVLLLGSGLASAVDADAATTRFAPTDDRPETDRPETDRDRSPVRGPAYRQAVADDLGLTDEQIRELRETARELRAAGADRQEIRRALRDQLESYGYEADDVRTTAREVRATARMANHFGITDEQADDLYETVRGLRAEGASAEEIRETLRERLSSYGLNDAEVAHAMEHVRHAVEDHRLHRVLGLQDRFDLTDGQMDEITETIREERADGASPEEIREAVRDDLESFGVGLGDGPARPVAVERPDATGGD